MQIQELVDLKPFNTMAVAAKARYFTTIKTQTDVQEALAWATEHGVKPFVLGGGANLLITTEVLDRLVMRMAIEGLEVVGETDEVTYVKVGAGEDWHATVDRLITMGYAGLENLALIPGTVGASVVQNIGAYGTEVAQRVQEIEVFNPATGEVEAMRAQECDFAYRHSIFKDATHADLVVLSVTFALPKVWTPNLSYKELTNQVEGLETVTARDVFEAVVAVRSRKLPDPKVLGSAGSFFKNPVVDHDQFLALLEKFPSIVHYDVGGGHQKLAAGWMIDQAGLKGHREGDAGTYEKQALVLVNHGEATGAELWRYAQMVKATVKAKFGVDLEPEPVIL